MNLLSKFIKAKPKKSDEYYFREASNITENHIIKINLPNNHHSKIHDDKAIISCKNVKTYRLFGQAFYILPI